jgi:hypothetical protein
MPDETNTEAGTSVIDAGGAGSESGGGNGTDAGAAASGKDQGTAGGEETITIKKSEYEQVKTDRDNYKAGLIARKADERELKGGKDESAGKSGETSIDLVKVNETAVAAASKVLRDAGERGAKRLFLKDNPEYVDDAQWAALVSNLTFKGGEVTEAEVLDRMNAALLEHKRSTGKLDEYLKTQTERARREGRIQGQIDSSGGTGGAGDRNEAGRDTGLSEKGKEMARAMHVDPDKAGKIYPLKDNVINIL